MSILARQIEIPLIDDVTISSDTLSVDLSDGRSISVPLAGIRGCPTHLHLSVSVGG